MEEEGKKYTNSKNSFIRLEKKTIWMTAADWLTDCLTYNRTLAKYKFEISFKTHIRFQTPDSKKSTHTTQPLMHYLLETNKSLKDGQTDGWMFFGPTARYSPLCYQFFLNFFRFLSWKKPESLTSLELCKWHTQIKTDSQPDGRTDQHTNR